jgi:hypothetical protein
MTRESLEHIQQRVTDELKSGATVDIYALAKSLQMHCSDLTAKEIAEIVARFVVNGNGNAIWAKETDEQT